MKKALAASRHPTGEDSMVEGAGSGGTPGGAVRSPVDLAAGIFLIMLAVAGFAGAFNLPFGQLSSIRAGMLPKVMAVLIGAFGAMLVVQGLTRHGARLEAWSVRGPLFVLGAVLVFAATIRPWGLVVAAPLSIIVAALADRDSRPREVALLAIAMTLLSGLLFKELLGLPMPFDGTGLIPQIAVDVYVDLKAALSHAFAPLKGLVRR
jgi:hypothetical protein